MQNIRTIAKKELQEHLNQISTYIVVVAFLGLWEYFFFRTVFVSGEASLRLLFSNVPWLFLVFIPALVMGSFAKERSQGTLELLLTRPVKIRDLILGKFAAYSLFVACILLAVVPIGLSLHSFGNFDWGIIAAQYLASLFLAKMFISIGLCFSIFFSSQVASLLGTIVILFAFIIMGDDLVLSTLPADFSNIISQLGVLQHYGSMTRGVLDIRDVWYFISVTVIFLSLGFLQLRKLKASSASKTFRSSQLWIAVLIFIVVVTNVIGQSIPGRLDITEEKIYTLSEGTENVIERLQEPVAITVYSSSDLPNQFQSVIRNVRDLLRDYQTLGKGNLFVSYTSTDNTENAQIATEKGVRETQFNVIGSDEFQVKNGFLGLTIEYQEQLETIPFIQDTSDLEYQLTTLIHKLTNTNKPSVVFLSGHGEKDSTTGYSLLAQQLGAQFGVETIQLSEKLTTFPAETDVVVIGGPKLDLSESVIWELESLVDAGKSLLVLVDGVDVQPQTLGATTITTNLNEFLKQYGVNVDNNLVYDLRSNETITFGGGAFNYVLPYPFWVRSFANENSTSPITSRLDSILFPWPSSLRVDQQQASAHGLTVDYLFESTQFAGVQIEEFSLLPDQDFDESDLSKRSFAVALSGGESENSAQKARLVVVADSDFLSEEFIQNSPENLAVGAEIISWLTKEESLANIQLKQRQSPRLVFESEEQTARIRYMNLGGVIVLPVLYAIIRIRRRNRLKFKVYSA